MDYDILHDIDRVFFRHGETGPEPLPCDALVEGFIPGGSVVLLAGASKRGKTAFATALALAIAQDRPFLNQPTRTGAVLWYCLEESENERALLVPDATNPGEAISNLWTSHLRTRIDTDEGREVLSHWLYKTGAELVVVDPLYEAVGDGTLEDNRKARRMVMELKLIAEFNDATILLIHHLTKASAHQAEPRSFADAMQLQAAVSMVIHLTSVQTHDGNRLVTLTCCGRGAGTNRTLHLRSTGPLDYTIADERPTRRPRLENAVLDALVNGDATNTDIAAKTGFATGSVKNALSNLQLDGRVQPVGRHARQVVYGIIKPSS